ncbi:MAG: hypothetical protein NWE95_07310 [Candidatus Bathyarchaeota archaeon]|nr:hypothetical protein [Candidatus Bathyarchaeota archaeon]
MTFVKAGYLMLAGGGKSLKIQLRGGEVLFVAVADVQRALREPKFAAVIVKMQGER